MCVANQRKPPAIHETHSQYSKMPKLTPAELSRMKADKEARDSQDLQMARRRQEELSRQANNRPPVPVSLNHLSSRFPFIHFTLDTASDTPAAAIKYNSAATWRRHPSGARGTANTESSQHISAAKDRHTFLDDWQLSTITPAYPPGSSTPGTRPTNARSSHCTGASTSTKHKFDCDWAGRKQCSSSVPLRWPRFYVLTCTCFPSP